MLHLWKHKTRSFTIFNQSYRKYGAFSDKREELTFYRIVRRLFISRLQCCSCYCEVNSKSFVDLDTSTLNVLEIRGNRPIFRISDDTIQKYGTTNLLEPAISKKKGTENTFS